MIVGVVEALQLCPLRSALATAQEAQLVVFASTLITSVWRIFWGTQGAKECENLPRSGAVRR
jgi:hypothetical protein